jgi:hypothetical protein
VLAQSSDKGDTIWQHDRTGLRVAAFRLNLPSPGPLDPAVVKQQLLDRLPALRTNHQKLLGRPASGRAVPILEFLGSAAILIIAAFRQQQSRQVLNSPFTGTH